MRPRRLSRGPPPVLLARSLPARPSTVSPPFLNPDRCSNPTLALDSNLTKLAELLHNPQPPQPPQTPPPGWSKPNTFHVCITSYTLALQDAHMLKRKKWKYLILARWVVGCR